MTLKENIIHESLRLFSLKGYCSTSITDILDATGVSKGGFYNHFASKEGLFFEVLEEARIIWRKRVLYGLNEIDSPLEKAIQILANYRDRYLRDTENFPGGCVFVTFTVELNDQFPHLVQEVNKGFIGLKSLLKRLLDESMERGELKPGVNTGNVIEILFSGMLGTSVVYGVDKSNEVLGRSIDALINHLEELKLENELVS
jgi:TetR/AcrR family transcriptional regulator, transcriptional repressor for nem operon